MSTEAKLIDAGKFFTSMGEALVQEWVDAGVSLIKDKSEESQLRLTIACANLAQFCKDMAEVQVGSLSACVGYAKDKRFTVEAARKSAHATSDLFNRGIEHILGDLTIEKIDNGWASDTPPDTEPAPNRGMN